MTCDNCGGDHATPGDTPTVPFVLRTSGDAMLFISQHPDIADRFAAWIRERGLSDVNFSDLDKEMFLANLETVHGWAHFMADEFEIIKASTKLLRDLDGLDKRDELNDAPITEYMDGPNEN